MAKKYVEIVSGEESNNIVLHNEDPTNKEPAPCYGEDFEIKPMTTRKIVGIIIDDNNIVIGFTEKGYYSQFEKGLRMPISETEDAVIGKKFPI